MHTPNPLDLELWNYVKANNWVDSMANEHARPLRNDTWKLVPLEDVMKVIGNRWVYKVKSKHDRSIDKTYNYEGYSPFSFI